MNTVATPSDRKPRRSRVWTALLLVLFGLLVGFGLLLFFVRAATHGIWDRVATDITGRTLRIDSTAPTIVDKIQRLQRLETVTYTMDKVVEGDRSNSILPDFLVGDRLLLSVHGEAIAGVDLGALKPSDVSVDGKTVHVHLPPAQIFVTALDNGKTKVYSRSTGLFVPADPNLESEVRAKAQQELQNSAQQAGILDMAHKNAAATVTKLILTFGFDQVQVD
ncbi:DUF4230 domain-containing protein [Silvibacterium acidisoli]|uniref:DUF4230 domain-containing protein n=1 Tax=Acidobacteriaceae bacterium ZG23-2 TaxID=2883246 RepID=UPI00406D49F3